MHVQISAECVKKFKNEQNLNISETKKRICNSRPNNHRKIRCELVSSFGGNLQSISIVGVAGHWMSL
jgi:hypothetical protein